MTVETIAFDASEFFDTEASQTELIADAYETGDVAYIAHALGVVSRARGMTSIARSSGVSREALYKALTKLGDPKTSTLLAVTKALGYKLRAVPVSHPKTGKRPSGFKARADHRRRLMRGTRVQKRRLKMA